MQSKICLRVTNLVLVIFRVMSAVKSKCSFPEFTVNIPRFILGFIFSHDQHFRFDKLFPESSCLSHTAFDHLFMVLAQHGWYRIPFGGKLKEGKEIILPLNTSHSRTVINIGEPVLTGIFIHVEIPERKTF